MKKRTKKPVPSSEDLSLFLKVRFYLDSDLCDPVVELGAREVLADLRGRGYRLDPTLEDDGCLACLHMALSIASSFEPAGALELH